VGGARLKWGKRGFGTRRLGYNWFLAFHFECVHFENPQQSGNVLTTKEMDLSHDL